MNIVAIISGTLVILAFSWFFSVRHDRHHGIPRFFAFESIYIMLLFNISGWFNNPFSPRQIISWILLVGSAYSGLAGYLHLKKNGKSEKNFENTTTLVTSGIYGKIRHPLYLSLMLLGCGIMFKDPGRVQLIAGAINLIACWITALVEEKDMLKKFGSRYQEYKLRTSMFIPYII